MLFFAALLLILAHFLSVWAGTPFPIDLVTSDSVSPALMEGDVVAWTPTTIDDVKVTGFYVWSSWYLFAYINFVFTTIVIGLLVFSSRNPKC